MEAAGCWAKQMEEADSIPAVFAALDVSEKAKDKERVKKEIMINLHTEAKVLMARGSVFQRIKIGMKPPRPGKRKG